MNILQFIKKQWMAFKEDLSNWKGQRHQRRIEKQEKKEKRVVEKGEPDITIQSMNHVEEEIERPEPLISSFTDKVQLSQHEVNLESIILLKKLRNLEKAKKLLRLRLQKSKMSIMNYLP